MRVSKHLAVSAALASLVAASPAPQQLNFAEIAAAPTIPKGPKIDGLSNQTASLYTSFTVDSVATPTLTATGSAQKRGNKVARENVYSTSMTIPNYAASFGTPSQNTTVSSGSTYWLSGGGTHNFFGNIINLGSIIVSQTSYLKKYPLTGGQTSDWIGHDTNNGNLQNSGLIQLNDIGSASAPTYDWYIRSMSNDGTIQWCGRGDTGGSTYQMYNDLDSVNNGLISFEQSSSNIGAAFVWRNPTLYTTSGSVNLYNNGAFRLINVVYHNVQNIYGTGCWQLEQGSVLYLEDGTGIFQNPSKGSSLPGQSIVFKDSSADLHLDTAVYSRNSSFGPQVYGFADGNAIEFYEIIASFSYSSNTGLLTVTMVSKNVVNIKLGLGYDASKFSKSRNPSKYNTAGYNAIFYNGSAPYQSPPTICVVSAPICQDLSKGLSTAATTSSASSRMSGMTSSTTSIISSATTTSASSSTAWSLASSTSLSTVHLASSSKAAVTPSTSTSRGSSISSTTDTTGPATSTTFATSSPTSALISSSTASASTTISSSFATHKTTSTSRSTAISYFPYYPALATSYTTDLALTATTASDQACPTQPEAGTYCGFINPEDPCAPQPDGYGPVPTPDTAEAFLAFPSLHALASAAPSTVPSNNNAVYTQVFLDRDGATSGQSYIGLVTMQSYDVDACGAACDTNDLCTAFNVFAERDPSLAPSKNDSTAFTVWGNWCPNPPSMTSFKCTLWGSNIGEASATSYGQWREDFHVVITASTGYDKTNSTSPTDPLIPSGTKDTWSGSQNLAAKAIDSPQYFIGSKFFPGPFNPRNCASYASQQNVVNAQALNSVKCLMFNAYYLTRNGEPYGTYCGLYTTLVHTSKATYQGGQFGSDTYEIKQSYVYTLSI